ncbi:hypothetical protein C8Q77DRAFT_1149000 [Trametes polyzona]|nr:hypothetical protein C8Q77DRAFT_1149000 [Trametes polyzona]
MGVIASWCRDGPQISCRFPGQENAAGDNKIPSILYYKPDGTIHSVGAEAAAPAVDAVAEDEGLVLVKWFKLHLRPNHLKATGDAVSGALHPLPPKKSVVDVFADFLSYLFRCARDYISEVHASGTKLWESLQGHIDFVLSHPNGWEGAQQSKMREAAVKAGLVQDAADKHIHFITEGEASLNFCIRHGFAEDSIADGAGVTIVDAGGGTIDISSYSFLSSSPLCAEEVVAADCLLQGSTQVNVRAEGFLREHLHNSEYNNPDDLKSMMDSFENSAKLVFRDRSDCSYLKFGSVKCNDPVVGIRRGQLTLSGEQMEAFFKPALTAIVKAITSQTKASKCPIETVLLVGGFAASPWLRSALQKKLDYLGLSFFRPDTHTSKAVAEGAVVYHLEHYIRARVLSRTYGVRVNIPYKPSNPAHQARRSMVYTDATGAERLSGAFSVILTKGVRMREGEEVSHTYHRVAHHSHMLNKISVEVLCYRGKDEDPEWVNVRPELFVPVCTIYADTSAVQRTAKHGSKGVYYCQAYDIILVGGHTELQAQICWKEDGEEKRGPASIVYDDDIGTSQ